MKIYKKVIIPTTLAEIFTVENILTKKECDQLIVLIKENNKESMVTVSADQVKQGITAMKHHGRTSRSATFSDDNSVIKSLRKRIRSIIENENDWEEPAQGQWYSIGGKYDSHYDFFENLEQGELIETYGNRTYTCLIYLNSVEQGGETEFSRMNIKIKPKPGLAVIWRNLDNENVANYNTIHAGLPVVDGEKFIITQWYRENQKPKPLRREVINSINNMETKNTVQEFRTKEELPRLTDKGFWVEDIPTVIWKKILEAYENLQGREIPERGVEGFIIGTSDTKPPTLLYLDHVPELRDEIHNDFLPYFETWFSQRLERATFFGIRSYHRGAVLSSHTDRISELHASGIILVDEDVDKPWGLDIRGYDGIWHNVVIKPGQIILYESAKLEHARLQPLEGNYYRNCYVHYKLKDWQYIEPSI